MRNIWTRKNSYVNKFFRVVSHLAAILSSLKASWNKLIAILLVWALFSAKKKNDSTFGLVT